MNTPIPNLDYTNPCVTCGRGGSELQSYCMGKDADGHDRCMRLAAARSGKPWARLPLPFIPLDWEGYRRKCGKTPSIHTK